MPAPTRVARVASAFNTGGSPKTAGTLNVIAGDVISVKAVAEDAANTFSTPTGLTGATWTQRVNGGTSAASGRVTIWTTIAPSNQSTVTISVVVTNPSSPGHSGIEVTQWDGTTSAGVGQVWSGGIAAGSGVPSVAATPTGANSTIDMAITDWAAIAITGKTYRTTDAGAFTETAAAQDGSRYSYYVGYHADSGAIASKTIGMTAPTGMRWTLGAVEILGAGGTTPVNVVHSTIIDATATLAAVASSPLDAAALLAQVRSAPFDAMAGVAAVASSPTDAQAGVAAIRSAPFDSTLMLAPVASAPLDSILQLGVVASSPVDGLAGVAAVASSPFEALASLAAVTSAPWDATSSLIAVNVIVSVFVDAVTQLGLAASSPWDGPAGLAITRSTPLDAVAQLAVIRSTPFEAVQGLAALASAQWDAIAQIAALRSAPWETTLQLALVRTVPYEALAGVLAVLGLPWESDGDGVIVVYPKPDTPTKLLLAVHAGRLVLVAHQSRAVLAPHSARLQLGAHKNALELDP